MILNIRSLLFIAISGYLLSSQAQTVVDFPEDMEYCFRQGKVQGVPTQTTLSYNYRIREEDYYKRGDIFVAFRFRSKPNQFWLFNSLQKKWVLYEPDQQPVITHANYSGILNPLIPLNIFREPTDLSDFVNGGELWVGYGLRENENASINDSFQEMLGQRRYHTLWQMPNGDVPASRDTICLTATRMTVHSGLLQLF